MYLRQDGSRNNLSDHFVGSLLRESKWLPKLASTCSLDLKKTVLPVNILRLGGFSKRDFVNFSTMGPFGKISSPAGEVLAVDSFLSPNFHRQVSIGNLRSE